MVCHCALNSPCRPTAWNVKYGPARPDRHGSGTKRGRLGWRG
jgi:hypothetical protein